jgi:hypothetical protein
MEFSANLKNLLATKPKMKDEHIERLFAAFEKEVSQAIISKKNCVQFWIGVEFVYCRQNALELLITNLEKEGFKYDSMSENVPMTFSPFKHSTAVCQEKYYLEKPLNCTEDDICACGLNVYF